MQIRTPPPATGSEAQQLAALRDYLFYMQRALSDALTGLDESNFAPESRAREILEGRESDEAREERQKNTAELRQLILRTADVIRTERDELETRLGSRFVAESAFGSYSQQIDSRLTAAAEGIEQEIAYRSLLEGAVSDAAAALDAYVTRSKGTIRAGIVDWNGDEPVFGIAVGQDVKAEAQTVTVGGREWEVIDKSSFLAVFTASRLSFYVYGQETAWLSNHRLYITNAHVSDLLELGDDWEMRRGADGLVIRWTGE